jgi:penicillin-insensitive murein endopeptidase
MILIHGRLESAARLVRRIGAMPLAGLLAGLLAAQAVPGPAAAADAAKHIFGAMREPSLSPPEPHGSYSRGCLSGGVVLPETGPGWQAMRLSRNRNWGHPEMIAFIERLSRSALDLGWPRLLVGDISQPRGGPMVGGHASHQIGLDVDIWLRIPQVTAMSVDEREQISSNAVVRPDRLGVNQYWHPVHHDLLRLAAKDPAVVRVFVNAAIKKALCEAEPPGDRDWLRKIRPWQGHDAHFHVRLNCPPGALDCVAQEPPPPGDGCGADLAWWFTDEALHPKPETGTRAIDRRDLTLNDLPAACQGPVLR